MSFSSMNIGRTGVGFAHHWLDTIAHNIANANTVAPGGEEPFRALQLVARPLGGGPFASTGSGVHVAQQVRDGGDPARTYDPDHPLADEQGTVTQPVVDLGSQMVDMMIAQRAYQANLRTVESAKEAYQAALRLGGSQ
ncbi:flagellar basal body rod protein FlgC [Egicoccus halophilus]|uniref:Flagellar basal-body rod protein FlgC n=1 Tax=Egicoccus halophilus TaxID=1670830 RepID=A0A8J3A8K3_9ACTN|nr:flagellar basal body rod C-terminal domain-containing protein [Egicoccus halophilus]GGI06685.1 flagellar basal-body rod protein FlgC [Egicoccus halophilus]